MTAPMQASKWLSSQLLVDAEEMAALMQSLGDFSIYTTSCVVQRGSELVSHEQFLQGYKRYVTELQHGRVPDEKEYRHLFSSVWTYSIDLLAFVPVENDRLIVRVVRPVVQLQPHRISYSEADGQFRSKAFGQNCITWGIQFSYPQLFQDPTTRDIQPVDLSDLFPNTILFQNLQRWVRHHTAPTPFLVNNEQINVPIRLGKNCFSWINQHPQLADNGLKINSNRKTTP